MKKIIIGVAVILAVGGYIWWSMSESSSQPAPTSSVPSESINPNSSGTSSNSSGSSNPPPAGTPATGYKDGTYTGEVATSIYGPVQVAVTITNGKIVTVRVPVFPNSPGHTTEVSDQSIPILKQEAIAAQSARVDIVSGATQTVEAFQQSLASALAKAS